MTTNEDKEDKEMMKKLELYSQALDKQELVFDAAQMADTEAGVHALLNAIDEALALNLKIHGVAGIALDQYDEVLSQQSADRNALIMAGTALYGAGYDSKLAELLNIGQSSRIRQMASGKRRISPGIINELSDEVKTRRDEALHRLLMLIKADQHLSLAKESQASIDES